MKRDLILAVLIGALITICLAQWSGDWSVGDFISELFVWCGSLALILIKTNPEY